MIHRPKIIPETRTPLEWHVVVGTTTSLNLRELIRTPNREEALAVAKACRNVTTVSECKWLVKRGNEEWIEEKP